MLKEWAVYKQDKRNEANALDERCKELKRQALVDYHEGRTTDAHVATREYLSNQRLRDKALKEIERYTAREEQIRSLWQDNQAAEINRATAKMLKRIAKHQDPEAAALEIDETEDIYDHFDEVADELEQEVSRIRTAPRNEADSPDEIEDILRGWSVPGGHAMTPSAAAAAGSSLAVAHLPPTPQEVTPDYAPPPPPSTATVTDTQPIITVTEVYQDPTRASDDTDVHQSDEQHYTVDPQADNGMQQHETYAEDTVASETTPLMNEVENEDTTAALADDVDTGYHDDPRQMWEQRVPQENKDTLSTTVLEDLRVPTHELPSGNDTDPEDQGERLLASVPT